MSEVLFITFIDDVDDDDDHSGDDDDDGDDDDIFDRQGHQMERISHFCPRCFVALSITLTIPAWLQAEKTTRP